MLPHPSHISGRQPKTADCWDGTHPGLNELYSDLWENTRLHGTIFIPKAIVWLPGDSMTALAIHGPTSVSPIPVMPESV